MTSATDTGAAANAIEEYKSLRDETARRIDARNQILSYTLVFAASMLSLGLGSNGYHMALLVYPIVSFFFAIAFAYNSLMLIEIGRYLRVHERSVAGLGWASYLKGRYGRIEPFEIVSTAGLFIATQIIAVVLYASLNETRTNSARVLTILSVIAVCGTIFSVIFPVIYHRNALRDDASV